MVAKPAHAAELAVTIAGWGCRLAAASLAALVLYIVAAHGGLPAWEQLTPRERPHLVALVITTAGLLVMLRWLGLGGAIVALSGAMSYLVQFNQTGTWSRGWLSAAFPIVGLLGLVISVWQRRSTARSCSHPDAAVRVF